MVKIKPSFINLPRIKSEKGSLTYIQDPDHIPFPIKRIYYLYDVPTGENRGAHAHKDLEQVFIALSGSFKVQLDDGLEFKQEYTLSSPEKGLYIPKGYWRDLGTFLSGSVCLVIASQKYLENDYIRNYNDFIKYKNDSLS